MATFDIYLTSAEPAIDQEIYSQSIGGYCSSSALYPSTTLSANIGLYDENLTLDTPSSGNWSQWAGEEYISIGNEVIKVSAIVNGSISVVQRGYNGITNMHLSGDIVRPLHGKKIFNDVFSKDLKQYRCIALKNISSPEDPSDDRTMYNFSIYFKYNSRNSNSSIKAALEVPRHQYVTGVSSSWNSIQVVDSSLIGLYEDNIFNESYLKIISGGGASGQGRIIRSFDSATGTITLYSSFSSLYNYEDDVYYEIYPSPSQRIKTGTVSPEMGTAYTTQFCNAREGSALAFTEEGTVFPSVDLNINDVVYIWLERSVESGSEELNMNDIALNIKYTIRE